MEYLLDTNIVILYARNNNLTQKIEKQLQLLLPENKLIISVVTLGEVKAFAKKNNWGETKHKKLFQLLDNFLIADINVENIINKYAEIDTFSQGRLEEKSTKFSARNMGKNDLWIAATASIYHIELITTDKDFRHLVDEYIKLNEINLNDF